LAWQDHLVRQVGMLPAGGKSRFRDERIRMGA
jgi:hypothetical protein